MKKAIFMLTFFAAFICCIGIPTTAFAQKKKALKPQLPDYPQLGLVDIKSWSGRYLQAHSDNGEMHASHDARYTEETWELVEVDKANNIYAFINYSNGNYLSRDDKGCVKANQMVLGFGQKWKLISGKQFGFDNLVMFVSLAGYTMGANKPGDDTFCGGEVAALGKIGPQNKKDWAGWFIIEPCDKPTKGPTVIDWITHAADIVNKVAAAGKAIASLAQ